MTYSNSVPFPILNIDDEENYALNEELGEEKMDNLQDEENEEDDYNDYNYEE